MHWTSIFLLSTFLITVHSQIWNGTYIVNSTCTTTSCCCISNNVLVTRPNSSVLGFNTSLIGQCYGLGNYAGQTTYPVGYTAVLSLTVFTITVTFTVTLSNDSNSISVINSLNPTCIGKAVRPVPFVQITTTVETTTTRGNAPVQQYINMIMLLGLVFFSCVKRF